MKRVKKLIKNELFAIIGGLSFFLSALVCEVLEFNTVALVFYIFALIFSGAGVMLDAIRGIFAP